MDYVSNYISKWVKATTLRTNYAKVVVKFLQKNIFSRFGTLKAIVCDKRTQFCNRIFTTTLAKYGIKYKVAATYYPQISD